MKEPIQLEQLFAGIEARLAALDPKAPLGLRRDKWLLAAVGLGLLLTLLGPTKWLGSYSGWDVVAGLLLEACGLTLLTYRQVRDVAPDFVDAKKKFAMELQ